MEVCLRGKRCREGCAQVASREGFVLGEGAYGTTRQVDVCESGAQSVVAIPFARDRLECVDVCGYFVFIHVSVDAGPRDELLDYVQ
jgi:hypothetical protein